jgi:ABC-2 type transport system ATP-binding protein
MLRAATLISMYGIDQSSPLLSLDCVRVEFGALRAVDDISMTFRGGELLGLIGPNGAGKTTLLRAVAGLQPLSRGVVRVLGERVAEGACPVMRHIGFSPDTPPVYEEMTVRTFLRFVARGYDLSGTEVDERIDFWLEKVWLTEKANSKIRQLSRGMRQRIGIARTLLPNPSLILLDEPAAGLDPAGRVQFRELLSDLRDQGKTLIVSSHILADMSHYCTHIGMMSAGKMIRFGSVREISDGFRDDDRCRYTFILTSPIADLEQRLSTIADMTVQRIDRERVTIEFSTDREAAAALLRKLIAMDLPIASFAPHAPGLEEAYLRTGIAQVD